MPYVPLPLSSPYESKMSSTSLYDKADRLVKTFIPNRDWQKYCSYDCRKKAWNERHNIKDLKALAKRVQELESTLNK